MLVATAIGPVDIVLLMGGRSMWNLFNVVVALGAQPGAELPAHPAIGIAGAACAWAASILFNNIAPLAEIRAFLKLHPFGRGFPVVSTERRAVLRRLRHGDPPERRAQHRRRSRSTSSSRAVAYAALMWRFRSRAELELLAGTLRARRGGRARPVTA